MCLFDWVDASEFHRAHSENVCNTMELFTGFFIKGGDHEEAYVTIGPMLCFGEGELPTADDGDYINV